jgi:hypothetical protein
MLIINFNVANKVYESQSNKLSSIKMLKRVTLSKKRREMAS